MAAIPWQVTRTPASVNAGQATEVSVTATLQSLLALNQIGCLTVAVDGAFSVQSERVITTPSGKQWEYVPPVSAGVVSFAAVSGGDRLGDLLSYESVTLGITVSGSTSGTYRLDGVCLLQHDLLVQVGREDHHGLDRRFRAYPVTHNGPDPDPDAGPDEDADPHPDTDRGPDPDAESAPDKHTRVNARSDADPVRATHGVSRAWDHAVPDPHSVPGLGLVVRARGHSILDRRRRLEPVARWIGVPESR